MGKFKSKEELGGEIDPRINVKGNPNIGKSRYFPEKMSNRQLREREFMTLLRKVKPHQADAIMTAVRIMKNQDASDTNKLKSAALLVSLYRELVNDVYNNRYDEDGGEEIMQDNSPVFSLKIVNGSDIQE